MLLFLSEKAVEQETNWKYFQWTYSQSFQRIFKLPTIHRHVYEISASIFFLHFYVYIFTFCKHLYRQHCHEIWLSNPEDVHNSHTVPVLRNFLWHKCWWWTKWVSKYRASMIDRVQIAYLNKWCYAVLFHQKSVQLCSLGSLKKQSLVDEICVKVL